MPQLVDILLFTVLDPRASRLQLRALLPFLKSWGIVVQAFRFSPGTR